MRGATAIAFTLAFIISGCVENSPSPAATKAPPTSAPPATVTADTGGIEGTVTDEELRAVPGADVSIIETKATAKTDPQGKFSFSGLVPGSYGIVAQSLGYTETARKVTVETGAVAHVNLTMRAIVIAEPYVEPLTIQGYIRFGNAFLDIVTATFSLPGCEKCVHKFNATPDVEVIVFEFLFTPTLPIPTTLYTQTYGGGQVGGPIYVNKDLDNREKVVLEKKWKDGEKFHQLLYCGRMSVCAEQRYTEYVSLFHNSVPAEDFTALPP